MNRALLRVLRCPDHGGALSLLADAGTETVETGTLACTAGCEFPIIGSVPRFVPAANYAGSFGLQWNRFRQTQLDSHSGVPISERRFHDFTGWQPDELRGKLVLDVGCGAGRFTEVALAMGAHVVAIDYSSAVDACVANHGARPTLDVAQADIYRLPFEPGTFDFIYCLGVLQHTPDPRSAFLALPPLLKPGGRITVDLYPKLPLNLLWPKYWLRPLTRRLPAERLFRLVEAAVPVLLPLSRALGRLPFGRRLRYVVPVVNYEGVYPLSEAQLREWAVLDTYDMLAPAHDHPQTAAELRSWLEQAGLKDVSVHRQGFLVARGRR